MKLSRLTRRRLLRAAFYSVPVLGTVEALWWEPTWLKVREVRLGRDKPTHRIVHFTDVHHKGDKAYLQTVVKKINQLSPDFVCFTGDLVEEAEFLPEALEVLAGLKSPLYGVPGNHDYWSQIDFAPVARCFESTGGSWLMDRQTLTADGRFNLIGATCNQPPRYQLHARARNLLLLHFPAWANKLPAGRLDLILAGHSHGGQVRLPFYGALVLPYGVGKYDLGLFATAAGPLYVGAGIGFFLFNIRFNCRPEITVFEL